MDLLPSRGYVDPEVLTIHIQRKFIPVGAELVAGLTAICAVVCFVQYGNDEISSLHNHSFNIRKLTSIFCPKNWLRPKINNLTLDFRNVKVKNSKHKAQKDPLTYIIYI